VSKGNLRDIAKPSVIITLREDLTAETNGRTAADGVLQNNIDAEKKARIEADDALRDDLGGEASARDAADADLQIQIDNLHAIMNLRGSVETFTDLPDPTTVSVNDGYIVHTDETRGGITSIYVSDGTEWVWVGEFSVDLTNYYVKSETDALIAEAVAVETQARNAADNVLREEIENKSASPTIWVNGKPLYGSTVIDLDENNNPVLREDGRGDWLIHLTMLNRPLAKYIGKQITDAVTGVKYLFTVSGGEVSLEVQ
jgi:hypothetical protein